VTTLFLAATSTADQTSTDDVFGSVRDFFDSGVWIVLRNVALFFLVVFWVASAFWVYKDARRRVDDPWLLAMAVALGVFPPFVGPLLYLLFRPPEYLEDVRERELEIQAMEEAVGLGNRCPVCRAAIESSYLACPVCTTKLKQACRRCKAPLEPLWQICPYCETPVDAVPRAVADREF
jgi:hypothetical protein